MYESDIEEDYIYDDYNNIDMVHNYNHQDIINNPLLSGSLLKNKVFNNIFLSNNTIFIQKNIKSDKKAKKYHKMLYSFFSKLPRHPFLKKKPKKFLSYLLLYFLITHDLHFFLKKFVAYLQNVPRRFQYKIIRSFTLLNQPHYKNIFNYFKISGVYFTISGKFGGLGGSKKMKKKITWFKPKFADRNLKIQRSTEFVWSFSGTTTWSIYVTYRLCLIAIQFIY